MHLEQDLSLAGHLLGGAIGNGIECGVDGYNTYEDIRSHQYVDAAVSGAETLYHGAMAVIDGYDGHWL
jgi:hypothetical protein